MKYITLHLLICHTIAGVSPVVVLSAGEDSLQSRDLAPPRLPLLPQVTSAVLLNAITATFT